MNDHNQTQSPDTQGSFHGQLFTVAPNLPISVALSRASGMLSTALVLCDETSDSEISTTRALNEAIYQLIEAGKTLIDAAQLCSAHTLQTTDLRAQKNS